MNRFVPWPQSVGIVLLPAMLAIAGGLATAQDVFTAKYKPLPAAGSLPDPATVQSLQTELQALRGTLDQLARQPSDVADVTVMLRAVELAISQRQFHGKKDAATAAELLAIAKTRLKRLMQRSQDTNLFGLAAEPLEQPQAIAGGFVSQIDDSVQPYGLVLPTGWSPKDRKPRRLDVWLHGRGDSQTEMQFLQQRLRSTGPITPDDTLVLHPFGRHCNGFKFAGETDVFEAIEHVRRNYAIDPKRISIRGFSMGGAGCWHLAVHHPGQWFAANPGAGFADTMRYQGWEQKPPFPMSSYQRTLLNWYDCPPWAINLSNTQVVAYSGENDKQKLAADMMVDACKVLGLEWPHVIGAGMGHKIDKPSAQRMDEQLKVWAAEATELAPDVRFRTFTLRYPKCDWLTVEGMERHWQPASLTGSVREGLITLQTEGCTHLAIDLPAGVLPTTRDAITIRIDEEGLAAPDAVPDQPYHCDLIRTPQGWAVSASPDRSLRKRPGLTGPIDDALMQRFVFVRPSRPCWHGQVERWVGSEYDYATDRWGSVMRGDVPTVLDRDVDEALMRDANLILFGDPHANRVLAAILERLPIEWTREKLVVNGQSYDVTKHAVAMVFPNPLNPNRYVVLNSGMTFRDFSNVSNSRQIPMLPDWAVLDIDGGSNAVLPGEIKAAGFFNEQWAFPSSQPETLVP